MNKNNNALRVAVTAKINRMNSMEAPEQKKYSKLYSLLAVNKQIHLRDETTNATSNILRI